MGILKSYLHIVLDVEHVINTDELKSKADVLLLWSSSIKKGPSKIFGRQHLKML